MTYEFFRFSDLDAAIGLFAEEDRVALHFASQGGSPEGRQRNPERRKAFERLVAGLSEALPSAQVIGCRFGRSDETQRTVSGPLTECRVALSEAYRDGGWFRFDFWLSVDPPRSVTQLSEQLGLVALDHAPVRVMWPGATTQVVREDVREDFLMALDQVIRQVEDPSSTDQSKWRAVEELLASKTGVPIHEVVVGYVSARKHLNNRRRQRSGEASVRLLLTPDADTASDALTKMEDAVAGKISQDGTTVAVATLKPEGWRIINVFALTVPASDAAIRLASLAGVDLPSGVDDDLSLAESLFIPVDWLRDMFWLLEDKKGLVFYGPPGTGKTFLAQQIAKRLQPDQARRALVQLHPSYGYEEFFEGYRPTTAKSIDGDADDGTLRLAKRDGPLKDLISTISGSSETGILVLDEMNRGNLPRVFGELYFLLEYRDREVRLMYSPDEPFRLPEGFRIIGTMNTADRSVALLDQALRRRFHFVGLFPDQEPVKSMLRKYLKKWYGERMTWVADALDNANAKLDRNVAIGPSHFMRNDLNEDTVARIWRHSVLPTIEEHYFGQDDRIAEFDLEVLRPARESDDTNSAS